MGLVELLLVVCVLAPLAGAVAHRIKQEPPGAADEALGPEEFHELRGEIEALRERVDRLSEEQRFLVRLLEERPDRSLESASGERAPTERTRPR